MKKANVLIGISAAIVAAILALLCLVPFPLYLKDGGTVCWQPTIPVYAVYDYNAIWPGEDGELCTKKGYSVDLFGIEIWENTYLVPEA